MPVALGSAPRSKLGSSSEASARVPSPVVEPRRNERRWIRVETESRSYECTALAPGNGLVQVQEHACDGRPGRELCRVDVGGNWRLTRTEQGPGRGGLSGILI